MLFGGDIFYPTSPSEGSISVALVVIQGEQLTAVIPHPARNTTTSSDPHHSVVYTTAVTAFHLITIKKTWEDLGGTTFRQHSSLDHHDIQAPPRQGSNYQSGMKAFSPSESDHIIP
ncbi:unnamed protein product [Heterobilharzia americana]|nr:unnamed protein product [Heterobilharzia americana]